MHEGSSCAHRSVCGQGCAEGWDSCELSSSTGLQGFTPVLSSTLFRSSFLERITHTGLAVLQGIPPLLCCVSRSCGGSWGGLLPWTCCCPSFRCVFSSLIHGSYFLDTHGCSESPLSTREQVSPLPTSGKPKLLPALFLFPGQVWDERLARAAEAWAARCLWDHGPPELMKYVGQNLSIQSGR